jgi:NADH dehydrogenase (ubiquinone) 1 alpha subcomplex subunit 6
VPCVTFLFVRVQVLKLENEPYFSFVCPFIIQAPEICSFYTLNYPPSYVRYAIRQKFEANRHVTNHKAIDVLILKGRQEYQETMNGWKMIDQISGLLLDTNEKRAVRERKGFLEKFYEGACG